MSMNIEDSFKKDLLWLLSELKQEEMANAYSEYKIHFSLEQSSDEEPTLRSQNRLLKMLEDRKALTLKPFFHRTMTFLDSALQMQGARPIGFYVQILQPKFDEVLEEVTDQKATPVERKVEKAKPDQPISTGNVDTYFITMNNRRVILNNTFILSTPNFNGENANFVEYVIEHPDKTIKKKDFEDSNQKVRKSFHHVLNDLGFKGEIRKIFFDASKSAVKFRNNIPESELKNLGIDTKKLVTELSGLERIGKKGEDGDRDKQK